MSRDAELHLRPCADVAPHGQGPSDQRGAFRHAAQAEVSLDPVAGEHRRIDPCAIIPHAQLELLVVISDLDLDASGMRMPEGIPKGFRRNLVDFVTNDRVQLARLALDRDTECGRLVGARAGRELVAKRPDRDREVVAIRRSTPAGPAPRPGLR